MRTIHNVADTGLVDKKYFVLLLQVVQDVLERAYSARDQKHREQVMDAKTFQSGRLMAFNEVVSMFQQEAQGLGIDLKDVHLDAIDPDRDLL